MTPTEPIIELLDSRNAALTMSEVTAYFYITCPVILFFITFVRLELAIPAVLFLITILVRVVRHSTTTLSVENIKKMITPTVFAAFLVTLCGVGGYFTPKGDWYKHYAIVNFLAQNSWPPVTNDNGNIEVLRYSIGWYLAPALIMKLLSHKIIELAIGIWMLCGLVIFFSLLNHLIKRKNVHILTPLLFVLFSGADIIGYLWSGFMVDKFHLEWWSGWMEYSSNMTTLLWTPQYALPAWIMTVLLMNRINYHDNLNIGVLFFCLLLWSPFIALGTVPLWISFCWQVKSLKSVFHRTTVLSCLLIGVPLVLYLSADSTQIPHGWIWNTPCIINSTGPCFTFKSYVVVLVVEILPCLIVIIYLAPKWRKFAYACGLFAFALPLFRVGAANDIVMRASIPFLAFTSIVFVKLLTEQPYKKSIPLMLIFALGLPTVSLEIYSAMYTTSPRINHTKFSNMPYFSMIRNQYFARSPARVLRVRA